jgi:putative nucleotidyltransferase with HDIG domain
MFPANQRTLTLVASTVAICIATFAALFPVTQDRVSINEGAIATRTIRAPQDISFISEALTEERQEEAADAVEDIPTFDPAVAGAQQSRLNETLQRVEDVIRDESSPVGRATALQNLPDVNLSPGSITLLREADLERLTLVESEARRALAVIYDLTLCAAASEQCVNDVTSVRERVDEYIDQNLDRETSTLVGELIRPFIVTNQGVDQAATELARQAARAGVAPAQVSFTENQIIIEEGEPISPEAREALLEADILNTGWSWEQVGASAVLAVIATAGILAGLHAFHPAFTAREMQLIGLAVALPVFVMKVYLPFILPDEDRHFLGFLMPAAASSMLLAGFVGVEMALIAGVLIALLAAFTAILLLDITVIGVASTLDVARIVLAFGISAAAGAFAVRNADRLTQFLLGGALVAVSIMAVLFAIWLIDPVREWQNLLWMALAAGANGGLSAFLAAGIFVTLGSAFGVTTRLQLLEMSQLSQPLLLRLQDEAPSTFQHSVIVANLAEKGAHTIGADALLARVGCYYHDIGKLLRPGFFIENQLGGANPHDALDPSDSARIISDHVTDGINLARHYRLPAKVAQFIPEHHGTRTVTYFYRRAAEEDPNVDVDAFRYPGPKPQSRETAIAMLADSCEAAVRSNPDHSAESIDRIVEEVYSERLAEGQLDESDLTLKNIRSLADSFKATLRAVYHPRVEYPAPTEAEMLLRRLPFRRTPIPPPRPTGTEDN